MSADPNLKAGGGNEVVEAFDQKVDSCCTKLFDSYKTILARAQVESTVEGHEQAQILAASANIVQLCHTLLDQSNELRLQLVINSDGDGGEGSHLR